GPCPPLVEKSKMKRKIEHAASSCSSEDEAIGFDTGFNFDFNEDAAPAIVEEVATKISRSGLLEEKIQKVRQDRRELVEDLPEESALIGSDAEKSTDS